MSEELGNTLDELAEAIDLGDDDLLFVVRYPYSKLTSLKLKVSTLRDKIAAVIGSGDVIGPDISVAGNIPVFTDTAGKILEDSGHDLAFLVNRANHVGLMDWAGIDPSSLPTHLADYGITDAAHKITVQDTGTDVTTDVTRVNFVGFTVTHASGAVTVTAVAGAAGAPSAAKYIVQTPDAGLSAEQALSVLTTGLLKNTTGTGVLSIADPASDYFAPPVGSTEGDIWYRGASVWGRLALGAQGTYLKAGATSLGYGTIDPAGIIALTDAATIAVDATLFIPGTLGAVTITNNRTLGNPTGAVNGQELDFRIRQDGTGGYTLSLGTKFRLSDVVPAVVINATANKTTYLRVRYDSTDDKFDVLGIVQPA